MSWIGYSLPAECIEETLADKFARQRVRISGNGASEDRNHHRSY